MSASSEGVSEGVWSASLNGRSDSLGGEQGASATVVLVCTANICRSPVAERLLASLAPDIHVRSAGTRALVGRPIAPPMAALLRAEGFEARNFAATQLTSGNVLAADLVLCMERDHRSLVVDLVPSAVRRCFTLREFARLVAAISTTDLPDAESGDRLQAVVRLAMARRGGGASAQADEDIADPYGGAAIDYMRAFDRIRAEMTSISRAISTVTVAK